MVVLLSDVISTSEEDHWFELRGILSKYPIYKSILVKHSDGERQDWDLKPYDEATCAIEIEPIAANIARLDLPHWSP